MFNSYYRIPAFARIKLKNYKIVRGSRFVFFSSPELKEFMQTAIGKGLCKWGAHVRRTARQSMKKRKGAALPGNPPHVHEGSIKRLLYFAFDRKTGSVVVGPEIRPTRATGAPNVMEFGGDYHRPPVAPRQFKVGESGPVRVIQRPDRKETLIWATLHTQKQADRATALWDQYRVKPSRVIYIAPRPYMNPALKKNLSVAPLCFQSSLKGK